MFKSSKIRTVVLFVSIVMFCIQCKTAVNKLINPPIIDIDSFKVIKDIEKPVITVCVTTQHNDSELYHYGYHSLLDLLKGNASNKTSWGHHHNISFDDLIEDIFDIEKAIDINFANYEHVVDETAPKLNISKEYFEQNFDFVPPYGFCMDIEQFSDEFAIKSSEKLKIYITDKRYRSFFNVDHSSQKGIPIRVDMSETNMFDVDIKISSTCQLSKSVRITNEEYLKCVDDKIQKEVGKVLGCVPPWMSGNNQCNGTYEERFAESRIPRYVYKYVLAPFTFRNTEIEKKCRKHCSYITSTVRLRENKKHEQDEQEQDNEQDEQEQDDEYTDVIISFNPQVKITEKQYNYGLFDFIIDVGSSVGLWLGISVLGLYDLGIQLFDYLKSSIFTKVAQSAIK